MRKDKKPMPAILGVGTASVVFIFMLLSLVTFAVLAYSTATSDYRLSKKAVDRTTSYYEASNQAQERIGEVDELLNELYGQTSSDSEYMRSVSEAVGSIVWAEETGLESSQQENVIVLSWKEVIDEGQHLVVSLQIKPPRSGESFYEIEQYRVESSKDWNGDTSIKVYGSDKNE